MSDTSEQPPPRFEVHLTSDSHFGWIRTRLAVERTLMAYLRTGVALIGFGFTIVQFFQRLGGMEGVAPASRPQAARYLGLALIGAGVLTLVISGWQYRHVVRYLWGPQFRALAGMEGTPMKPVFEQSPLLLVVLTVTAIGVFAFFAVLLRMV